TPPRGARARRRARARRAVPLEELLLARAVLHLPRARRAMRPREDAPGDAEELVVAARAAIHAVVLDDLPRQEILRRHRDGLHARCHFAKRGPTRERAESGVRTRASGVALTRCHELGSSG